MRIAVQNPSFLFADQKKNFNGYNYEFVKNYADYLYVTDIRKIKAYKNWIKENSPKLKIVYVPFRLNQVADVLMCFNGVPYHPLYKPSKVFKGVKIYHVMDYVFYPRRAFKALENAKVDFIMAYCDHSKNDPFFRKYYPDYSSDRIIKVPFGYGKRFVNYTPFDKRINKAIALGSVNPVKDTEGGIVDDYQEFHKDEKFTHKLRRAIVEHRDEWKAFIDDKLPTYPETKNPSYDPVEELNRYTMFVNDAGLMNFPPARTYEGIASGCVMVAEESKIWNDLGFEDAVNCILFKKDCYDEMINKIQYYMNSPEKLEKIQLNAIELAEEYTHEIIAAHLYENLKEKLGAIK